MSAKKTILLIDDDHDLVEIIKVVLLGAGYEVVTAYNGVEGLERLKTCMPHLIVLDMNMPKMGGISFYYEIANSYDKKPKYPVLVLTARANLEHLFKELNVDGFMTKPFEIDQLLKEIELIISKRYTEKSKATEEVEEKTKREKKLKKVLIVDDESASFDQIVVSFANAGYVVISSRTGAAVIERALLEPPDLILLKLGLPDLPGDIVATKLKQMPKTMDIPLILYTPSNPDLNYDVINQICRKIGIRDLIELDNSATLLRESKLLLSKQK